MFLWGKDKKKTDSVPTAPIEVFEWGPQELGGIWGIYFSRGVVIVTALHRAVAHFGMRQISKESAHQAAADQWQVEDLGEGVPRHGARPRRVGDDPGGAPRCPHGAGAGGVAPGPRRRARHAARRGVGPPPSPHSDR